MTEEKRLYTSREVAKMFGLKRTKVKNDASRGLITPTKIEPFSCKSGKRYLFNEEAVNEYGKKLGKLPSFDDSAYTNGVVLPYMYAPREVAIILGISDSRVAKARKNGLLVPSDIRESSGRAGYKYVYDKEEIYRYANKIGLTPVFERIGQTVDEIDKDGAVILTKDNIARILGQDQQNDISFPGEHNKIGEVTVTPNEDGGVMVEGVIDICEEVPTVPEVVSETLVVNRYVIRVGKAYVSVRQNNELYFQVTPDYNDYISFESKDVERAKEIANLLGGKVYRIVLEEVTE